MFNTQIDLAQLADYMIEVVDCSADYEEDAFRVDYNGHAFYVERQASHFLIEARWGETFELPRP